MSAAPEDPPPDPRGCDIARYATKLRVSPDFLRDDLSCQDANAFGKSVRIPYYDETGTEIWSRFRIAVEGADKFRAKKGQHPALYGISRLDGVRANGEITIVIGESDCIALWFEGLPAIGLPTPMSWDEARMARHFDGFRRINVVLNPSKGADAILSWLRQSSIKERTYLVNLPGSLDPAALRLRNPMTFEETWNDALARAVSWPDYAKRSEIEARESYKHAAAGLLAHPDILEAVADQCYQLGIARERSITKLVYLCFTSRLLRRIAPLMVKGTSTAGKSELVKTVLRLFPTEAYFAISSMSNKALVYTPESPVHRMLVIYEATGLRSGEQSNNLRVLLTEGKLVYSLPLYTITKPGPTGVVMTTTETSLHHEMETRCLSVSVDESDEQTTLIVRRIMDNEVYVSQAEPADDLDPQWHALQHYLALCRFNVVVPFSSKLGRLFKTRGVLRWRRDINVLRSLIGTHALLHHETRERDSGGAIIGTIDDYRAAYELINDVLSEGNEAIVPKRICDTRQAVADILSRTRGEASVSLPQLAHELRRDKSVVSRNVKKAIELGYLRDLQTRKGQPARIVLGIDIEQATRVLPHPDELLESGNRRKRVIPDD